MATSEQMQIYRTMERAATRARKAVTAQKDSIEAFRALNVDMPEYLETMYYHLEELEMISSLRTRQVQEFFNKYINE